MLKPICDHLSDTYKQAAKVNAIIYLHPIKNERMTSSQMLQLEILRDLCGVEAYANVVLATTFWDELPIKEKGIKREDEMLLKSDMWGDMAEQGSKAMRFYNTRESALDVVMGVADFVEISPKTNAWLIAGKNGRLTSTPRSTTRR